jgi:hypothetical protein
MAKNEKTVVSFPVGSYHEGKIPGLENAKLGVCFVRAIDVPAALDDFMEVNPRVPSRGKTGVLTGPVAKGILETLREAPHDMAIKNQGIYLLTESVNIKNGTATVTLSSKGKHGIVNGGHTYAAIREAVQNAESEETTSLADAWVRFNIYQDVPPEAVAEMAEGLNRSRQVDDPSLANLQGEFDIIRKAMKGKAGADQIAYHQGDAGEYYISEILVYLEMFNTERFNAHRHPNGLYNRQSLAIKYFLEDLEHNKSFIRALVEKLPDILELGDLIRKEIPEAARRSKFKFGMAKLEGGARAGGKSSKGMDLPFLGEHSPYRVPNGWVYPILSAFRANLNPDMSWKLAPKQLLAATIDDLAAICVSEYKQSSGRPELLGKRDSAYSRCFTTLQLELARKRL